MSALFRWGAAPPESPRVGDRRAVTVFLWWPRRIRFDVRWLGWETYTEEWQRWEAHVEFMGTAMVAGWRPICWGDATAKVTGGAA